MKYTYTGKLKLREDFDYNTVIFRNDKILLEEIVADMVEDNFYDYVEEKKVSVRYTLSDKPIEDIDEAFANIAMQLEGDFYVEYRYLFGTEWTGLYGLDEELKIGGHDLFQELYEAAEEGSYLYLEITVGVDD